MATKPLSHIRVLELGGYIALPYCTSLLRSLGADVVKVEKPVVGDDFRRGLNALSPYFVQYNAGKRSLAIDLKSPEGIAVVRDLIPHFDVVVENMRPGKLESLGLGPESCKAINPALIYTSINGFGDGGPLADRPAYDTIGQAYGGIYSLLGDPGGAQLSGTIFADLVSGMCTVTGVLAGLVARDASGEGHVVKTSIMEAMSAITVDAMTQYFETRVDPSRQSRHPQAQNFCLLTSTGESIAVHLSSSQKFWMRFCEALGQPELVSDSRFLDYHARVEHYFELTPIVQSAFLQRSFAEWEKLLTELDVPFAPVLTMSSYAKHPQVEWLEMLEDSSTVPLVRAPWRFDGTRPDRGGPTPHVGEHSREILSEILDNPAIDELVRAGVVFAADAP